MNLKFLMGLGVVLWSGSAHAQVSVKGTIPPIANLPLELQLQLDPKLPAMPKLDIQQPPRLEIRVLDTYRGSIFQLEVVRKKQTEALEAILAAMDKRSVMEPELKNHRIHTAVFRALSLEGLLSQVCGRNAEMWKSSSGTYFFADKPNPVLEKILEKMRSSKTEPLAPRLDPFNVRRGQLRKIEPEPEWGKVPFNGREFYVVPLPSTPKAEPAK